MQLSKKIASVFLASTVASSSLFGLTTILSNNGQNWDIDDNTGSSAGYVSDGSQDAFDDFGQVSVEVRDGAGVYIDDSDYMTGFNLNWDGDRRFNTLTPQTIGGVSVSRSLYAPSGTDYLRYIDTFTNTSGATRKLVVAWGGNLGSDSDTTVADTSSGDLTIGTDDSWAITIENDSFNPAGPATDPVIGYLIGVPGTGVFTGAVDTGSLFGTAWSGNGNDNLGFEYTLTLAPGESASLAYFLYRGLEEETTGPLGQTPAAGEEIALAQTVMAALAASPNFSDLSPAERSQIVNFNTVAVPLSNAAKALLALMFAGAAFFFRRDRKPA